MNKEVMILIDLQTLLFELESKFPFYANFHTREGFFRNYTLLIIHGG